MRNCAGRPPWSLARSTTRTWLARGVGLGAALYSVPALAMSPCPDGTGSSPWLFVAFWGSFVLMLVLLVLRATVFSTVPDEPRPRGQALVVLLAILSPFGGVAALIYGILICAPLTQAPEVVCEHFEEEAHGSREPVGFDVEACRQTWRAEQEELSSDRYRALSSCVVRISRSTMYSRWCAPEGFDPLRHAPGSWPRTDAEPEDEQDSEPSVTDDPHSGDPATTATAMPEPPEPAPSRMTPL